MTLPLTLAGGLVGWSLFANLVLGDRLYVARNLLFAGALLVTARQAGLSWSSLGLGGEQLRMGVRWGTASMAIVAIAVTVGALLADHVGGIGALLADERAARPAQELAGMALWRIPVGTALFEEIAFRAVLLSALLAATTPVRAVVISSVAFGLWHIAPTIVGLRLNEVVPASASGVGTIVGAVAVTTLAGVAFAVLRLVSGSVVAPVLAHWAVNALGLSAAALTQRAGG